MIKVIKSAWFTEMGSPRPIGIVIGLDEKTGKEKAYIGTGAGLNEKEDEEQILRYGAKFPAGFAQLI